MFHNKAAASQRIRQAQWSAGYVERPDNILFTSSRDLRIFNALLFSSFLSYVSRYSFFRIPRIRIQNLPISPLLASLRCPGAPSLTYVRLPFIIFIFPGKVPHLPMLAYQQASASAQHSHIGKAPHLPNIHTLGSLRSTFMLLSGRALS